MGINQSLDVANISITLNFNSSLIKANEIIEGPWPKNYAEDSKPISRRIDNAAGTVTYSVELYPPRKPNPPTVGILFTVTFHVIYESPTHPPPSSKLTLNPTEIFDRNKGLILHITENSMFTAYAPPPAAKFTWTPPGNILPKGRTITFNATESHLPQGIKRYIWNFGDGHITTSEKPTITHIYQEAGTVAVFLNVTDDVQFWAVASATIYIVDEPQKPPTISVVNPHTGDKYFTFYTNTTSISSRFNTTIHVYNVANLQAFQIYLEYNSTLLNFTRAWLPVWETAWVFYGKSTAQHPPTFGQGYIQIADSIKNGLTFSGNGMLCIIEFEIIYAPKFGEASCILNINNTNTFLLDSNWNEIPSNKIDGNYAYVHEKLGSTLHIIASPSTINFGQNTTISGSLNPPRLTKITLHYRLQEETKWENLATVSTSIDGRYSYTWTPLKAGNYTIVASWPGDENARPANKTTILIVNKATPTLTINIFPKKVAIGSSATIKGTISIKGINFNITIQYRLQGDISWNTLATIHTNTFGHYAYTWNPKKEGTYELRTVWLGDENTLPAQSPPEIINVEPQPTGINPYIVIGTAAAAAFIIALGIYFLKRKRK